MAESFYKSKLVQNLLARRRQKRTDFVLSKIHASHSMSILDIGCGPNGRSFEDLISENHRIVGIDLLEKENVVTAHPNFRYLKQDAQNLQMFADNEFDLAVSFGMMEHICDHTVLKRMYLEIDRVSKQWIIVVPWKFAFIEPHFKFPFFQLLPYPMKVSITKMLNLHGLRLAVRQDYDYIKKHYQWLTSSQWIDIFEGATCFVTPHMDTIALVKADNSSHVV